MLRCSTAWLVHEHLSPHTDAGLEAREFRATVSLSDPEESRSAGAQNVDRFLLKMPTLSEDGKRINPEKFWKCEQRHPAQKRTST